MVCLRSLFCALLSISNTYVTGEVISEFLNAMLDSELPIDALSTLTRFLKIDDASSVDFLNESTEAPSSLPGEIIPTKIAQDIWSLSKACRTELLRAQGLSATAERVATSFAEETQNRSVDIDLSPVEPLTPPAFSQRLQESMHVALMKVMEERDMSHARFAAAEVLHIHEMEQKRKQNARLVAELDGLRSEKSSQNEDTEKQKRQLHIQQNSDDELMSLCQQLAGEISARTAASLEVVRLKESRQMECEHHRNEVQSLKDEIQKLREELQDEKAKTESASTELSGWRRSYRDVLDQNSSLSS